MDVTLTSIIEIKITRDSLHNELIYLFTQLLIQQFDYINVELADYIGRKTWEIKPAYLRLVSRIGAMIKHEPTKDKVDSILFNMQRYRVPEQELRKMKIQA